MIPNKETKMKKLLFAALPALITIAFTVIALSGCDLLNTTEDGGGPAKVATPAALPGEGALLAGDTVALSTETEGAFIYYTTDGATPDRDSAQYGDPIVIDRALTIKALAVKEGLQDSDILEAAYTVTETSPPGKAITAFSFTVPAAMGIIDGTSITVAVPPFTSLAGLTPAITVFPGASVEPRSGEEQDFTSPVTYTVTAEDSSTAEYTVTVTAVCIDMAGATAYLAAPTRGETGTETDPIPLPLRIFLDDSTGNGWRDLLKTIQDGGKYVELDLSTCTMSGTEFDPGGDDSGESYITAIILPDTAESTKVVSTGLFRNFSALKSVRGDNIVTVGAFSFVANAKSNNNILTTVEFPYVESIGIYAFAYCAALTRVNIESVIILESAVFRGCTALRELSLPRAESIGNEAFRSCTALATLFVPKAVSLGDSLFEGTGGTTALTLTLGSSAPSLRHDGFGDPAAVVSDTVSGKSVTIRIPSGAQGYDTAWKDKFKTGLSGKTPVYEEYTPEEE
jgi:hypothetical protein